MNISGRSQECKPRYEQKFTFFFFTHNLHYESNATNLISCVVQAWKARHMTFQVNPFYGEQETDGKLLYSPSIVHVFKSLIWEQKHWFVLQAKYCSLLMDHNQTYVPCTACAEIAMCEVSEKFILWKLIQHTEIIVLHVKPLWYLSHHTLTLYVVHAWKGWGVRFQEKPWNGTWDTQEWILCTPSGVFHNPPISTKIRTFVAHAQKVQGLQL